MKTIDSKTAEAIRTICHDRPPTAEHAVDNYLKLIAIIEAIRQSDTKQLLEEVKKIIGNLKENNPFTPCPRCRVPISSQNVCTCKFYRFALTDVEERIINLLNKQ